MKKVLTLLMISSLLLVGCSEPEVKPNKQAKKIENLVENEVFDFKGGINYEGYEETSRITKKKYIYYGGFNIKENSNNKKVEEILKNNNQKDIRIVLADYTKDGKLKSLLLLCDKVNGVSKYPIYGSASDIFERDCKGDKEICEDLKRQGESLKPQYEQFLKDYDITTKELKEYFQYKYDKYVQDRPD